MGRPKKNGAAVATPTKKVSSLDGFQDIITERDPLWDALLRQMQRMSRVYGFSRMEAPMVEDLNLYHNFYKDPAIGQSLVLAEGAAKAAAFRPSILPGILRAYGQHKIIDQLPLSKWWYSGPVFSRHPKTQKLTEGADFGFRLWQF